MSASVSEKKLSRGEILFPDADWDALDAQHAQCTDHASEMKFFAKELSGASTIGSITEHPKMMERLEQVQRDTDTIIAQPENLNKTGQELDLLHTPGMMTSSRKKQIMMNSSVLTPQDLLDVESVRAHGPAEFVKIFMVRKTEDGDCTSVHSECSIIPSDPSDGKALLFPIHMQYDEEKNPKAFNYILNQYKDHKISSLGLGEATSDYGAMLSAAPGERRRNGLTSFLLAVREEDWHLTMDGVRFNEKAGIDDPANRHASSDRVDPVHVITLTPMTTEQHTEFLQIEALFWRSLAKGEVPRLGRFLPNNNCATFPASLMAMLMPDQLSQAKIHTLPLDQLSLKMLEISPKILWVKDKKQAYLPDILPTRRTDLFEEISQEVAIARMKEIYGHSHMYKKQYPTSIVSFGNIYLNPWAKHPNAKACKLINRSWEVTCEEVAQRARGSDNISE